MEVKGLRLVTSEDIIASIELLEEETPAQAPVSVVTLLEEESQQQPEPEPEKYLVGYRLHAPMAIRMSPQGQFMLVPMVLSDDPKSVVIELDKKHVMFLYDLPTDFANEYRQVTGRVAIASAFK